MNIYTQRDILHTDINSAYQNINRQKVVDQLSVTCPELTNHFRDRFNNNSMVHHVSQCHVTSINNYSSILRQGSYQQALIFFCYGANLHNHSLKLLIDKEHIYKHAKS